VRIYIPADLVGTIKYKKKAPQTVPLPIELGAWLAAGSNTRTIFRNTRGSIYPRVGEIVRRIRNFSDDRALDLRSTTGAGALSNSNIKETLGVSTTTPSTAGLGTLPLPAADFPANQIKTWEWWERMPDNASVQTSNIFGLAVLPGTGASRRSGVRREWDGTAQTAAFRIYNDGTGGGGTTIASNVPAPRASIQHWVVTYDVSAAAPQPWKIYKNGVLINSGTSTRTAQSETDYRLFHQMLNADNPPSGPRNGSRFLGLAIYLRVLTLAEIQQLYVSDWYLRDKYSQQA
jgi:hypothetical protein